MWSVVQYGAFGADMLSSAGYEMVVFFFVLSGFFIRYAQLRRPRPVLQFYVNRIARIYPPYAVSLALAAGVLSYLAHFHPVLLSATTDRELSAGLLMAWHEMPSFSLSTLFRTLVFLKSGEYFIACNKVYWSLLPEAMFYLAVPFAFQHVRTYYALSTILYVYGLVAGALQINISFLLEQIILYNGFFALGVGLYDVVTKNLRWLAFFRRASGAGLVLVAVGLLVLLICASVMHKYAFSGAVASILAVLSISSLLSGRVNRQNILIKGLHELGIFSELV